MEMEDENISGETLLELIKDNRILFHEDAHSSAGKYVPNAILIHPGYYAVLKEVIKTENTSNEKKVVFDLKSLKQKTYRHLSTLKYLYPTNVPFKYLEIKLEL